MAEEAEAMSDPVSPEDSSMDQLREILFGQQRRDYDSQFKRIEELILQQHQQLQNQIEQQIRDLKEELKSEESARLLAIDDLSNQLKSTFERITLQTGEQQSALSTELSELRQQLDTAEHELQTAFTQNQQQLEIRLDDQLSMLENDKINKANLSEMLLTLAESIKKG